MSQNKDILNHMQEGRSITALQALSLYGSLALHSRISDLRQSGHEIKKEMIWVSKGQKRVGRYTIGESR